MPTNSSDLNRIRVLVVEDNFLVADDLSQTLRDWGCDVVGPAPSVREAILLVEHEQLQGAILDINLGHEKVFPVAAELHARDIPFLFLTGYDGLSVFPPEFQAVPRIPKPVDLSALSAAMTEAFAGPDRSISAETTSSSA